MDLGETVGKFLFSATFPNKSLVMNLSYTMNNTRDTRFILVRAIVVV